MVAALLRHAFCSPVKVSSSPLGALNLRNDVILGDGTGRASILILVNFIMDSY